MSSKLIHRGWSINAARKTTMLICAVAVTPIFFAQYVDDLWMAVAIISLATAAHQAWSANLYTLPGDTFPRKAVGSVIGIGGTAGAVHRTGEYQFDQIGKWCEVGFDVNRA